ncbi:hypothetical protein L9F63_005453, partial [Diploptera punctata]
SRAPLGPSVGSNNSSAVSTIPSSGEEQGEQNNFEVSTVNHSTSAVNSIVFLNAASSNNIPNSIICNDNTNSSNVRGLSLNSFISDNGDNSTSSIPSENPNMERLGVVTVNSNVRGVFVKNEPQEGNSTAAGSTGGIAKSAGNT